MDMTPELERLQQARDRAECAFYRARAEFEKALANTCPFRPGDRVRTPRGAEAIVDYVKVHLDMVTCAVRPARGGLLSNWCVFLTPLDWPKTTLIARRST